MNLSINNFITATKNGKLPEYKPTISITKPNNSKIKTKDSIEILSKNNEKPDRKKKNKLIAFTGFGLSAVVATVAFLHHKNKISKVVEIAQDISFKKAETIQEAKDFGIKTFGIEEYEGFDDKDLDILNWFNEGVFNIANKYKNTKLRMPKKIVYEEMTDKTTLAGVIIRPESEYNGYFYLNKNFFNNIDEELEKAVNIADKMQIISNKKDLELNYFFINDEFAQLLKKYSNSKALSFQEKLKLYNYISDTGDIYHILSKSPEFYIEHFCEVIDREKLGNNHLLRLPQKILKAKNQPKEEQFKLLVKIIKGEYANQHIRIQLPKVTPFSTVYHEFGHLQDMQIRPMSKSKFDNPFEYPKELNEWLEDKEKIRIAQSVSMYSTYGPGEFVAEVYARLIEGFELDESVLDLYKKLKGPSIPGVI